MTFSATARLLSINASIRSSNVPAQTNFVHLHVLRLAYPECTIRRLILNRRIPPPVEVKDVVGTGKIQAAPASLERKHEERRAAVSLKTVDHLITPDLRYGSMEKEHLPRKALGKALR